MWYCKEGESERSVPLWVFDDGYYYRSIINQNGNLTGISCNVALMRNDAGQNVVGVCCHNIRAGSI